MKITDALLGEHAVLYRLLDHCQEGPWDTCAQRALGRVLQAALASHASIEDRLLFHALEPFLESDTGPLAVMRLEHAEIEALIDQSLQIDDPAAGQALFAHIAEIARSHFAKEEQVLFPLVGRFLDATRQHELGDQWAKERGVTMASVPLCA